MSEYPQAEQPKPAIHVSRDLLPDDLREKLVPLMKQDELGLDAVAHAKYFSPVTGWTWYPIGFDGEQRFVGLVDGWFQEPGFFSIENLIVYGDDAILRDLDYQPKTIRELRDYSYQFDPGRYLYIPLILVEEK